MRSNRLARAIAAVGCAALLSLSGACSSADSGSPVQAETELNQPEPDQPERTELPAPEEKGERPADHTPQPEDGLDGSDGSVSPPTEAPAETPGEAGAGPTVEHRSAESPDGRFRIETYGINDVVTAGGLFPPEGLRLVDAASETVLWSSDAYYIHGFLWSPDSRYVAVYRQARTHGEALLVDTDDFADIALPRMDDLVPYWTDGTTTEQENARPDPYFELAEWTDNTHIRVRFQWFGSGDDTYSGIYTYDAEKQAITDVTWDEAR